MSEYIGDMPFKWFDPKRHAQAKPYATMCRIWNENEPEPSDFPIRYRHHATREKAEQSARDLNRINTVSKVSRDGGKTWTRKFWRFAAARLIRPTL